MEDAEYDLMNKTQDDHWWYLGRRKIIETTIENNIDFSEKLSIADAGCGFGGNILMLKQYGNVTGLELNEKAILKVKEKWGNLIELIKWKSPEKLNKKFDLILLTDVLEHIPDDQEAVSWIYEHLNNGGYALLTVPAHQFLWSQMDEVAHHYRRYGRKDFLNLFKDKFIIKKFSFYINKKIFFAFWHQLNSSCSKISRQQDLNILCKGFISLPSGTIPIRYYLLFPAIAIASRVWRLHRSP